MPVYEFRVRKESWYTVRVNADAPEIGHVIAEIFPERGDKHLNQTEITVISWRQTDEEASVHIQQRDIYPDVYAEAADLRLCPLCGRVWDEDNNPCTNPDCKGEIECLHCHTRYPAGDSDEWTTIQDHGHCRTCHEAWKTGDGDDHDGVITLVLDPVTCPACGNDRPDQMQPGLRTNAHPRATLCLNCGFQFNA